MLTVACVLKKGGDYNAEYVKILLKSVLRHSHEDIECICLTDTYATNAVTLQNNWSGWWSKIELFKIPGPVVYFDLDTVIINDLTPIYDLVRDEKEKRIWMLKPFGMHEIMASGIMAWSGDWSELHDTFDYKTHSFQFRGDQDYLSDKLIGEKNVEFIQTKVSGIYSYKYHCRTALPNDARIVCFHGRPRPVNVKTDWMKMHWTDKC